MMYFVYLQTEVVKIEVCLKSRSRLIGRRIKIKVLNRLNFQNVRFVNTFKIKLS